MTYNIFFRSVMIRRICSNRFWIMKRLLT